jgi:transcriptional regulator with XRE-family HTH domain
MPYAVNAMCKDKNIYQLIGHRIRFARMARGVTQEQLALACGVAAGDVRDWEVGRGHLPADALVAIVEALAIPLSYLFDD